MQSGVARNMKAKSIAVSIAVCSMVLFGGASTAFADEPAAQQPVHYSTAETPVGALLDDPRSRAVLEAHVPAEMFDIPQVVMVRGLTLRQLQGMAPSLLTNEVLDAIDAGLASLAGS